MKKTIILYIALTAVILLLGIILGMYLAGGFSGESFFFQKEDSSKEVTSNQSSQDDSFEQSSSSSLEISLEELKQKIDKKEDFILLDVRTKEEYQKEHIPKAISMPVDAIDSEYHKLSKEKEIIVYCSSGCSACSTSSNQAYNKLKELGATQVRKLEGSFSEWKGKGWPIEK